MHLKGLLGNNICSFHEVQVFPRRPHGHASTSTSLDKKRKTQESILHHCTRHGTTNCIAQCKAGPKQPEQSSWSLNHALLNCLLDRRLCPSGIVVPFERSFKPHLLCFEPPNPEIWLFNQGRASNKCGDERLLYNTNWPAPPPCLNALICIAQTGQLLCSLDCAYSV